ncbi:MAG: glycosyltransferase family A protein [Paludibacteraceae bacterium]
MIIPKVSIIVPVYNAGEHLSRCLDSLLNQTLKEIEIILVVDCPTDGSDLLAEKYAEQDTRIRIIKNEKNIHIGFSRNAGIDNARGEYLGFSDDDDYCETEMFEKLYLCARKNEADIVVSNYCNENSEKRDNYYFPQSTANDFKRTVF